MISFFSFLKTLENDLLAVTDEAELEAKIFLCQGFSMSMAQLIARLSDPILDRPAVDQIYRWLNRRLTGEPLAYVLGEVTFCGHLYEVWPGVLIPRPETELLVAEVHSALRTMSSEQRRRLQVLECGFGSGILSIELALAFPDLSIQSWDISDRALEIAQRNASLHQVSAVQWYEGDFFADRDGALSQVDPSRPVWVLSNPPYIPHADVATLDRGVRDFEPHLALDGGGDGLDFYRRFLDFFSEVPVTQYALEFGQGQSEALQSLFRASGYATRVVQDYANIPRILLAHPATL